MVKRIVLLILPILLVSVPAMAQDYSLIEISLGYGNWGADASEEGGSPDTADGRVSGFAMHTDINFNSWFGFDNYLGAYSMPGDLTLITNVFGAKVTGRDVVGGRISPYVVAGAGFGYYTSNQFGGSLGTSALRYGGGVDVNMSEAIALRIEGGGLSVGRGVTYVLSNGFIDDGRWTDLNVAVGILFRLGN